MTLKQEKSLQERFPWERSKYFAEYNIILGYYKAMSCIENSHGPTVLDMPCGDGTLTKIFSEYFPRVIGVDASATHLAVARKMAPKAVFYESLIEELHLDEKFDSIFMLDVLEHVLDPVVCLKKTTEILKDDGVLIVHVPNANAINRKIAVLMGTLTSLEELSPFDIEIAGHRRSYNLKTLVNDIVKSGLKIQKTGGIFYKMLSTAQMDWLLKNGLWEKGGFGWGRVGAEKSKDWKYEFCRACYEIGKTRPEDCNVIYVCATKA